MAAPDERPGGEGWQAVVIGAGQAGLAAAHELARRGLRPGEDFAVLDASAGPGGAWRERWDSLTLGRAHRVADLPGLPLGSPDPRAPASRVVSGYYDRYERVFDLRVQRPVRVRAVRASGLAAPALRLGRPSLRSRAPGQTGDSGVPRDTWLAVEAEAAGRPRTLLARMVISATGTWTHPYVPWVPGAPGFRGRQMHTADYRRAEDLAAARVVVVGGGLSAVQFLLELAPVAASTTWATRRPPNFTRAAFDEQWGAEVERAVDRRTAAGTPPASVVRTTGIPLLPEYLRGVREGVLVSRGMFDRVGPEGVRFSPDALTGGQARGGLGPSARDGSGGVGELVVPESWRPFEEPTWVEADVLFWNTGFRHALTHLAPLRLREPGGGIRMSSRVAVARDPRVLMVGYGSSASTLGATRAGREAGRVAVDRLGLAARR